MKQQKGFTLIELIVVIVILGILAATALPRFSNLTADARMAKMNGLAGSLRAASAMAHGQLLAEAGYSASSVKLQDGTLIAMSAYYPSAQPWGVGGGDITSAIDVTGYVVSYPTPAVNGANIWIFPDQAHANTASCGVSYVGAYDAYGGVSTPTIDAGQVSGPQGVIACS